MPSYESPSLYIDFSRLPPPQVIENIDYEALVKIYQDQVVLRDPRLAKAVALNQSPTNVVLQAEAYGEMMVRSRINAAARAVMLPFATGSDLDNLGAFYNEQRALVPVEGTNPVEYVLEDDARFRRRLQLAPEAFNMAGSAGAYIFQALKADPTLRDASAMRMNDRGGVKVTLMASGSNPVPTSEQIRKVKIHLEKRNIKPLTDVVAVAPVTKLDTEIVANVTLYPGPDGSLVAADINKAITSLRSRISLLGRDLTRSAIIAALNQEGVLNVELISPAADIVVTEDQCAWITKVAINISSIRSE